MGVLRSRCWPEALASGTWPEGSSLEALAWDPGLRARGGGVQTDGWTQYPLYSTGHRPSGAAAQKEEKSWVLHEVKIWIVMKKEDKRWGLDKVKI